MTSFLSGSKFRLRPRPQGLVGLLIGIGFLRVILALSFSGAPNGVSMATSAVQWILCAASMILIAVCEWDLREHHPGITSLFRGFSYVAIAGSLLPNAASLVFFKGPDAAPPYIAELSGLAVTLFSAMLLEWLLRAIDWDLPPVRESEALARLSALLEIMKRSA